MTVKFLFLISMLTSCIGASQDLSSHRWENRLLLILVENTDKQEYQDQIAELSLEVDGVEDRKLLVYTIKPNEYATGLKKLAWTPTDDLYATYKKLEGEFEVILIGLDGGIKLRQAELLKNDKLFAFIDAMPMRRNELRKRE